MDTADKPMAVCHYSDTKTYNALAPVKKLHDIGQNSCSLIACGSNKEIKRDSISFLGKENAIQTEGTANKQPKDDAVYKALA